MSKVESLPDASLGNLPGAPGLGEGVAPSIVESKLVPGTMVLWSPANSEGAGTRLAVVIDVERLHAPATRQWAQD